MPLPATVELVNTIPSLVLTGNKVPLKFQASENLVSTEGSKSEIVLLWTSVAIENEYFDLLLAGETVRFTCKADPDNSGVQFHDNALGEALALWVALLASDLEKNYLISRYYNLVVDGAAITITAKEIGSLYSQEFTAGAGIDVTPTETNKTGVDKSLEPFYYISVLLYCRGLYVTELLLNVDSDGLAEADVSKILEADILQEFTWPESDSSFVFPRTNAILPWCFRYTERWGDSEYSAMQLSETYYAIAGGVSWMQQAKYNADASSFWSKLQYNKYFLSWAPLTRIISKTEPVKLYFINHTSATSLVLKAKLYTASSNTTITIETVTGVADKTLWELVLSPDKVGYPGLSDETLLKFEIWIADQGNVRVSEIRTYILDYTHYEHTRFFLFRNSLGAYELLRSTGLMRREEEYSRGKAMIVLGSDYTSMDRSESSIQNEAQQKFSVSLGWLSRFGETEEYRNWLRDFALSKEVYQIQGTTLIPIRLTGNSFDKGKDRDNTAGFSFDFVNAFTDEHFTKELTWNLLDESFNTDFEIAQ